MTDDLCSHDAYLRTCEATVVDVRDDGVVLDRTVFYPRGGGQPGDSGTLRWNGGECVVTDATKSRDDGEIVHAVDPSTPAPAIDSSVTAEIDWDRRYQHMRTHTALHALSGVVFDRLRREGHRREHGLRRRRAYGLRTRRHQPRASARRSSSA